MYTLQLLICSFLVGITVTIPSPRIVHPNYGLLITELVPKYGYPLESHQVQTDDGYILTMHRIPSSPNLNGDANKGAVLLMHGLFCSSVDWVNTGPENGLGFLLADAGFDVWLGNQRGNTWSRKHIELDPDVQYEQFFDFSFHEIGYYDLPAKIDYILNQTGQSQLGFVGHSQGTTAFFIMGAERPEYNSKISLMSALAPVAYMTHLESPLVRLLDEYLSLLQLLVTVFDIHEFLPHYEGFTEAAMTICGDGSDYQELCADLLFLLGGYDSPQLDRDFIPVITTGCPAGSSIKQIFHYLQGINSTNFAQYDHGIIGNQLKYGQIQPPQYDTSKITAPIALHYADNDWMSSPIDVERLAQELPNVRIMKKVSLQDFNHLDFIWAIDVRELINHEVVTELLGTF